MPDSFYRGTINRGTRFRASNRSKNPSETHRYRSRYVYGFATGAMLMHARYLIISKPQPGSAIIKTGKVSDEFCEFVPSYFVEDFIDPLL